jgi:hypothetical protein
MALHPDYVEIDDLKRYLRVPGLYAGTLNTDEDAHDDIELGLAITSASRAIDTATNRQFGVLDAVDAFRYTAGYDRNRYQYFVSIDDVMTTSGFIVESEGVAVTDYDLMPYNAPQHGRPYTSIVFENPVSLEQGEITVTAKYGWTAIPDTIKNATLLQAGRVFKRRDAPFGVAGSPEFGNEMRLLAKIDPDVAVLIGSYKRNWGAV